MRSNADRDAFASYDHADSRHHSGLSKREYMATQFLAALFPLSPDPREKLPTMDEVALKAVIWADALLKALNKPRKVSPSE